MTANRPRVHPELGRYYLCQGLREPYAVLDQDTDTRVFESPDFDAAMTKLGELRLGAEALLETVRTAGLRILPADPQPATARFVRVQRSVMLFNKCVAVATSRTWADRIARALNTQKGMNL